MRGLQIYFVAALLIVSPALVSARDFMGKPPPDFVLEALDRNGWNVTSTKDEKTTVFQGAHWPMLVVSPKPGIFRHLRQADNPSVSATRHEDMSQPLRAWFKAGVPTDE